MKIKFIGATEDVTGSMTLVETDEGGLLIDSGLYQGTLDVVKRNLAPLPFDPKKIKAIILTHAHLDHCGSIPHLIKLGFRGTIYCTRPTMKLANIIMLDSAHILEKEENHPLKNYYEIEHVTIAPSLFKVKPFHEPFEVLGMTAFLQPAGHILGAASVVLKDSTQTVVFSGDLGRDNDPLMFPPEECPPADVIVMESTYGGKTRTGNMEEELHSFIRSIKKESAIGLIASFAVARAQLLITLMHQFFLEHPEERVRLVMDGPMMGEANKIYKEFADSTRLPYDLKNALNNIEVVEHTRQWDSVRKMEGPLLIISSSGMVTGGRIWRHLENWQDDENAHLFLPGYQARGTAGRDLSEGKKVIHDEQGKRISWRGKVTVSSAFSSHADQSELLNWMRNIPKATKIFLNHGEQEQKEALKKKLAENGHGHVEIAGS